MPDFYCPFCQKATTSLEDEQCSNEICSECGLVLDESPLQDPSVGGKDGITSQHWSQTMSGAVGHHWDRLKLLRREDSPAGLALRRGERNSSNVLFSNTLASIHSVCEKLNLGRSLRKQIEETWYSVRGSRGLAKTKVDAEVAPSLGLAIISWVCRSEGMKIAPARLASLAGMDKTNVLRACLILQKIIGFPVTEGQRNSVVETEPPTVRVATLHECLAKIRIKNHLHAEEAEMFGNVLLRLQLLGPEHVASLAVACSYYLLGKFESKRKRWNLQRFCTEYAMSFNSAMVDFERQLFHILLLLVEEFTKELKPAEKGLNFVTKRVRDFSQISEVYSWNDLPENIRSLRIL